MKASSTTLLLTHVLSLSLAAVHVSAADWSQWRGPNRDGISKETGLLKAWPTEGPKLRWQVNDLGNGYGAPSIVGERIYVMANKGLEDEFITALEVKNGAQVWSTRVGKVGDPSQNPNYPAARSTPTVDGTKVYALGSDGDLACLETTTGKSLWKKSLRTDFGGKPGTWAYAESPLVDGDVVVVTPGGTEATVVALDKKSGDLVWKSAVPGGDAAGYASIVIANTRGVKQYIAFTAGGLIGLDATSGKFLWRYDRTKGAMGMSILTPVTGDGLVYSGAGRVGGGTVKVTFDGGTAKAEELYFDTKLPTAIGGTVLVGGFLYGSGGQSLVCADFKTGQIKWSERSAAPGAVCYADQRLYLHAENGTVVLADATPDAYREHGRFTPPNSPAPANQMEKAWAYPVISDGCLYVRNKNCLWSYNVKEEAGQSN